MTLQQFIEKYKGKKIDWDNAYAGQCVDLFRQYCHEVLGIKQPAGVVGAADFWANYSSDSVLNSNFEKIENTKEFVPVAGDVVIWNKNAGGGFGHIAVVSSHNNDTQYFTSFDQNWSKISYCDTERHTYKNVLGVLRPIKKKEEPMSKLLEHLKVKTEDEAIRVWDQEMSFLKDERKKTKQLEQKISELEQKLSETQEKLEQALQAQAEATPQEAFEEIKQRMEEAHEQEILSIKMQQDQRIAEATKLLDKDLKEAKEQISSLNSQLLVGSDDIKKRLLSRKFLLSAPTAIFNMLVAIAVLMGMQPDPVALATVLTSLNAVVALFVVPEAITDHQQRLQK